MARDYKYQAFTPPLAADEEYEPWELNAPEPVVPTPMLMAVPTMASSELAERLEEASHRGDIREFDLLLRAAGVYDKVNEAEGSDAGSNVNTLWYLYNVYGAPPGIDQQVLDGAKAELLAYRGL